MKLAYLWALIAAASAPGRAEADCGTPRWIGTPSGATVPAKGTLYFYDEGLAPRDPKQLPAGPIVRETPISDTVLRIDYASKADELVLDPDSTDYTKLVIDRSWRAPQVAPRVLQYWHHVYAWTCSSSDSVMIQIDQPTAAFRVRWKFADKKMREWIVPARTADNNINVVELGKINCGSTSIEPEELARGGELSLIAIRYDGSEIAVTGLPRVLSSGQMPTSEQGIDRGIVFAPGTEPIQRAIIPVEEDPDFAFHLFMIILGVLGGLLVVRFRSRALKPVV